MRFFLAIVIICLALSDSHAVEQPNPEIKLYLEIERLTLKWYDGLFGSTLFYEDELNELLYNSVGKNIEIPADFLLIRPYETGHVILRCDFFPRKWLEIHGDIAASEMSRIKAEKRSSEWWRSSILVGITGRIRKYRIERMFSGKHLILFLDSMQFIVRQEEKRTG
ncbi:MAG TPA: hypothetical protein VF857_05255 [Spirochaetota bacterium]